MTYKEQLYYLLSEYIKGNYTTNDFCNQFSIIYNTKLDYDDLSEKEHGLFQKLTDITERFSPYEEDLKIPNAFKSQTDVKDIAEKTYYSLMNQYKNYGKEISLPFCFIQFYKAKSFQGHRA